MRAGVIEESNTKGLPSYTVPFEKAIESVGLKFPFTTNLPLLGNPHVGLVTITDVNPGKGNTFKLIANVSVHPVVNVLIPK